MSACIFEVVFDPFIQFGTGRGRLTSGAGRRVASHARAACQLALLFYLRTDAASQELPLTRLPLLVCLGAEGAGCRRHERQAVRDCRGSVPSWLSLSLVWFSP